MGYTTSEPAAAPKSSIEDETAQKEETKEKGGWPLPALVIFGLISSFLLVAFLGWYFAQQEWLRSCTAPCVGWRWFPPLDQDAMFAVVRNSVTAAAALGLGVTVVLSYRRQRVAERTLQYTAQTQRLAVEAQQLAASAQELAQQRLEREGLDTLRGRYLDISQLLNKETSFARITALHALESLVVSWRQFKNDREASASLGLLLSTVRLSRDDDDPHTREFRATALRTLQRHMQAAVDSDLSWGSLDFDAVNCIGKEGIFSWNINGGDIAASPLDVGPLGVHFITVTRGRVSLIDNQRKAVSPEQNLLLSPSLSGGRILIRFTNEEQNEVLITRGRLDGGVLAVSTRPFASSSCTFRLCTFRGARINPNRTEDVQLNFESCTFHVPPMSPGFMRRFEKSASFEDCVAVDEAGEERDVSSFSEIFELTKGTKLGKRESIPTTAAPSKRAQTP